MSLVSNPRCLAYFCSLVSGIGIIPIKFFPRFRRIMLSSKSASRTKWNHHFSSVLVAILIVQWIHNDQKLSSDGLVTWISLSILITSQIFIQQEKSKMHEIVQFCNGLFQFDEIYPITGKGSRIPLKIKINMVMVYCMSLSAVAFPPGYAYGLHWWSPCKSSLVGYWIIPECSLIQCPKFAETLIKCVVLLINHWLWSLSMHGGTFCVAVLNTMCVSTIHQFIQRFEL